MISETDIARFNPEQQQMIRRTIDQLVKNGFPRKFLDLWPDGMVTYNSTAHLEACMLDETDD
jgi:hypothetical protein